MKWLAIITALPLLLAACAPPATTRPSPPPEAQPLAEPGAHDQRLDDVIQEVRDALEPRYGRLEIEAYRLPAGAALPTIAAHYDAALRSWTAEPALPRHIRAAQAQAWRKGGTVLAIALIETPVAGEQSDYAVLVVATKS